MILSREVIAGFSTEEYDAHESEIRGWLQAGAKDGTEAPPLVREEGHSWTRAEVAGLPDEEWAANEEQILAAVAAGKVA